MAIKAQASAQGSKEFKKYLGVASFRVLGVNPNKQQLEAFYGREIGSEPVYITEKKDNEDKPYKQLRITFMIQADKNYEDGKPIKENAALEEPLKTTISFFLDSRYAFKADKSKVQVIDKYGRTAWVTPEQAQNHQIPIYSNGPAKLDANYRPAFRGEEALTQFILNYLNVPQIDIYNRNTGTWTVNPNPEDCEGQLYDIKNYFNGNISELQKYCKLIPTNRLKLLVGIETNSEGRQYMVVYSRISLRNGATSYKPFKDQLDNDMQYAREHGNEFSTIYSDDHAGIIKDIHEYVEKVQETDFSKPADDPFAAADDLPFGDATNDDPFASVA